MKVLLYFENEKAIRKSGIGRALQHQKKALKLNDVEYTTNKHDNFDIAHINTYYLKSIRLIKKCHKKGIPVIVHGHSTKEDFRNSFRFWRLLKPFVYSYMKKTYSKADLIITPTPYSKRLIEAYDYIKCPVVSISNGIDLNKYASVTVSENEKEELIKKYKIKPNTKIVMGIGWMFERKGIHDFISIASKMLGTTFIWFGQLNKAINTKIVNDAIRNKTDNVILPGYVEQMDIIKMLHISDCFFFPSYEETEGIVLLEALACKTPLLVRDIGAFDYLTDSVDCYKEKSNEGFISKLNYIFNNDNNEVVNNGYIIAEERDLKKIGSQLKTQYENVKKLRQ